MLGKMSVEKAERIAFAMNNRDNCYLNIVTVKDVMGLKPIVSTKKDNGLEREVYAIQYCDMTIVACYYYDGHVESKFLTW